MTGTLVISKKTDLILPDNRSERRSTRSHPTLAPRPQICLIEGNGFCAVAGEGELNRRWEDLGMRCRVFYLLENDWDMEDII